MVFSTSLLKVDAAGGTTVIGTIAGTAQIDTAIGFNHAVIVVRETGGIGYTLNTIDELNEINDPQFAASNSVTHINGRFVYIPMDGSPAFFSDVGNGALIQTTSFFDAEELPDKNKVVFNFKNVLIIGGTDSFELFRDTATPTTVYTRLNARIQYGYIGGITEYADTFAFIGREKDQDVGIYTIGAGTANKISNEAIDTILSTYTENELAFAIPARFKWRGYDLLTYTLTRHSFGFWGGNWFLVDTRIGNENAPWRAGFVRQWKQKYYTALASSIGRLDKINTDYGNLFERSVEFGYYNQDNHDFTAKYVEVGISQGFNATAPAIPGIPAIYDDISLTVFSTKSKLVSIQTLTPSSVYFSDTGLKMFVLDTSSGGEIFQYTLSTAWDVSTASYAAILLDQFLDTGAGPANIIFDPEGTRLYLLDSVVGNNIWMYTLSTPWDLTTATYQPAQIGDISAQDANMQGGAWKSDGTKFYATGSTSDAVFQYTASTPWDASTLTYDTVSLNTSAQATLAREIRFNASGARLYLQDATRVFQYNLATAWDLSTASYASKVFNFAAQDNNGLGMYMRADESQFYISGSQTDRIYQYTMTATAPAVEATPAALGTVGLQLSRDNVLYSEAYFRSTAEIGEYAKKLTWQYPGGLGYYEGFMGLRLTTTADIEFSADKISIGI